MSSLDAAFHAEKGMIPAPLDGFGDEDFVMSHAVEVAGVEQCDSGLKRRIDGCNAFEIAIRPWLGAAHDVRHPHAAKAYRGYEGPVSAQTSHLHCSTPATSDSAWST